MMEVRHLPWLVLLAACDLKPAPKPSPPPPPALDAAVAVAPNDASMDVTQPCIDVGAKVAAVWIESSTNPTERAQLEQERTKIVRRMAENCTKASWNEAARACVLGATTRAALQQCQQTHVPPPPAPPIPPTSD